MSIWLFFPRITFRESRNTRHVTRLDVNNPH